jgi:hypothetical protein
VIGSEALIGVLLLKQPSTSPLCQIIALSSAKPVKLSPKLPDMVRRTVTSKSQVVIQDREGFPRLASAILDNGKPTRRLG